MPAPLEGLRVIDFTRVLAGPHCTKTLRDLGADVVKIEPPGGDIARFGLPFVGGVGLYYVQQNAGKRNVCLDLNYAEARAVALDLCRGADVIVENFRPGTLARFGLGYEQVAALNPRVVYVSISGYGQATAWRSRPAFAPTVQAESGFTDMVNAHFGEALSEPRNDACSHADVYTGLHGVIAVLAALQDRVRTGEGQHVDVSMAAIMLSINERAGALMADLDTDGEPIALSANESHIYELADGRRIVIATTPIWTPMFARYCAMMRRNDLRADPRFATAKLRRANLAALLAEVRAWILTFHDLADLQAQVSEAGLAIGLVRTVAEFADGDWAKEWGAVVEVDDRAGGTARMPGNPWIFSRATLPPPGVAAFQGEHNEAILGEQGVEAERVRELQERRIVLRRRSALGGFD